MSSERRPAFQCYASDDVLANGDVAELSHEAFGLFFRLYCRAWLEEGLPNDPERMARWARISREDWDRLWGEMAHLWTLVDGRWINDEQEAKRVRVSAYAASRSENGKKGGRPKKEAHEKHMVSGENHMQSKPKAKKSSPSPTPSPVPSEQPPPGEARPAPEPDDNLVGWWIKREERKTGVRPPDSEIGKQSTAAKAICAERTKDHIRRAVRGMDRVYPFSEGTPWHLTDLRKHFQTALTIPLAENGTNGNGRAAAGRGGGDDWRHRRAHSSVADGDPSIVPDDYGG